MEKIEITVKSVKKREGTDRYTICFTLCGDGGTEEQSHVLLGAFLPFEVAVGDRLCAEEYEEFVRGAESSAAAYKGADLLDLGDHSQKMLCDKLRRKGFSAEAAERACSYLAKKGMLREGDYMVTTTQHYDVRREGSAAFAKVPVDGSSKMPNTHMDAIEPFDYGDLKPFSTAYLPGYLADRYDEDADACAERAYRRMYNSTADALHATTGGYSEIHPISENINVDLTHAHYALLPVWMLHTRWKDKDFLFAMNGQTGRLIGDLPVDKSRVAAWFAGISLPLMAVLAFLLLL